MPPFILSFVETCLYYANELWLSLLIGFLLSGLFNEFIPTHLVERHLGSRGVKPILIASCTGVLLPVCCFGSLPIAVTLRRKGARLGPVLAFLVATPATSISALLVCWKLLGGVFTLYIFLAVIVMGLAMGIVGNCLRFTPTENEPESCCHDEPQDATHKGLVERLKGVLRYAFITLPREIGFELLLGVALASLIVIFEPLQSFVRGYLSGTWGYAFVLIFGLATYVCSTASVPMADALMQSGLNAGQGMTYLLVGPITSYGMLLVLHKEFGRKILSAYLLLIMVLSLFFGVLYEILF